VLAVRREVKFVCLSVVRIRVGRSMAQSASRWPLTAQALVRFQDRRYEICGEEAALGEVSLKL